MSALRAFLFPTLVLCSLNCLSQKLSINLTGKVGPYLAMEQKLRSKPFVLKDNGTPIRATLRQLTFRRPERGIPDLLVTYTFSAQDSILIGIWYDWDLNNFDSIPGLQPLRVQKKLIKKYEDLLIYIMPKLGRGDQLGSLSDPSRINEQGGFNRRDKWMANDTTDVYLYSRFAVRQVLPDGEVFPPKNMVQLFINHVPKKPPFSTADIEIGKKRFEGFIAAVSADKMDDARMNLSLKFKQNATDIALNRLKHWIKAEPLVFQSSTTEVINGQTYMVIVFQYGHASQPEDSFRVVYDADQLIVDVIPLTWKPNKD